MNIGGPSRIHLGTTTTTTAFDSLSHIWWWCALHYTVSIADMHALRRCSLPSGDWTENGTSMNAQPVARVKEHAKSNWLLLSLNNKLLWMNAGGRMLHIHVYITYWIHRLYWNCAQAVANAAWRIAFRDCRVSHSFCFACMHTRNNCSIRFRILFFWCRIKQNEDR